MSRGLGCSGGYVALTGLTLHVCDPVYARVSDALRSRGAGVGSPCGRDAPIAGSDVGARKFEGHTRVRHAVMPVVV